MNTWKHTYNMQKNTLKPIHFPFHEKKNACSTWPHGAWACMLPCIRSFSYFPSVSCVSFINGPSCTDTATQCAVGHKIYTTAHTHEHQNQKSHEKWWCGMHARDPKSSVLRMHIPECVHTVSSSWTPAAAAWRPPNTPLQTLGMDFCSWRYMSAREESKWRQAWIPGWVIMSRVWAMGKKHALFPSLLHAYGLVWLHIPEGKEQRETHFW